MKNNKKRVVIGVDAGGTKTRVVAIDEKKNLVFEAIGGHGSPAVSKEGALKNITELVLKVYEKVKNEYEVTFVQLGLSGLGVLRNKNEFSDPLEKLLNVEVNVRSDADLGLYSIIEDKSNEGILVISGTGSVVAGIKDDKTLLIGGYGVLLTESGSSYASVKMLVVNIITLYEDKMIYSELGKEFMELIEAKTVNDFRVFMYGNTKTEIASYSKFISKKAEEGNAEAIDILKRSGIDLALSVRKAYNNLNLGENAVIGFVGSFINKAPYVKEELLKTLKEFNLEIRLFDGEPDPIYGAYYMAKREGKI